MIVHNGDLVKECDSIKMREKGDKSVNICHEFSSKSDPFLVTMLSKEGKDTIDKGSGWEYTFVDIY